MPKSFTTTMPNFDGKSENFELFQDLLQTSLKIHNHLTEGDRRRRAKTSAAPAERIWQNS